MGEHQQNQTFKRIFNCPLLVSGGFAPARHFAACFGTSLSNRQLPAAGSGSVADGVATFRDQLRGMLMGWTQRAEKMPPNRRRDAKRSRRTRIFPYLLQNGVAGTGTPGFSTLCISDI